MPNIFSKHTVHDRWNFTASALLWRIVYAEPNTLVGECRLADQKIASFFCLDAATGKVYWNDLQLSEAWWTGIETVKKNIVFFHRYAKPDMPEHKGIEAHDLFTGNLLWTNTDLAFWFAFGDELCAYRDFFEKRVTYVLDAKTGEILGEAADIQALKTLAENEAQQPVQMPEPLDTNTDANIVKSILAKKWKDEFLAETAEFFETPERWVTGFYTRENNKAEVAPHLAMIDKQKRSIVYDKTLGTNYPMPVPDIFFVIKGILYCVENQKILHAIPV